MAAKKPLPPFMQGKKDASLTKKPASGKKAGNTPWSKPPKAIGKGAKVMKVC